jgi:protocatechuate 3,4-dioxygenase, beta subunit
MTHDDTAGLSRRGLLQRTLLGAAGLAAAATGARAGEPTPAQTEGPFHPLRRRRGADGQIVEIDQRLVRHLDTDTDLTFVEGREGRALGQVLYAVGQVTDTEDQPVAGALVEIWQACAAGCYNHRADPSDEPLDEDFQYWGRTVAGDDGRFLFKTVVPGAYRASGSWIRPPHIHVKVGRRGFHEVTSQLYMTGVGYLFEGQEQTSDDMQTLLDRDGILQRIPVAQREGIVSPAREVGPDEDLEPGARVCSYALTLAAVR